jgi:protein-disulfide isomerase
VSLEGAARVGSRSAKVVLIEYSDFQCPYCARAAQQTLPPVINKYVKAGKVQVVFRHLPLSQIHPLAQKAAEAAECAGQQGKFWEMHDVLFRNREKLDDVGLRSHAVTVGLDATRFGRCLDGGETAEKVRRDTAEARSMQITGTPTFLLGTLQPGDRVKLVRRAASATPEMLEQSLEAMLKEVGASL